MGEELGHDRARLGWLPRLVRLAPRLWPFHVDVDASPGRGGSRQDGEGCLEDKALGVAVVWHAEGMSKWELNTDDAWGNDLSGGQRHHCHNDGRYASVLDSTCQHGHVPAAIGSDRGEDDAVGPLG